MPVDTSADSRTRLKNKDQHPGAVQVALKRKRRTKAEIAADNAAQEAKKQEKARTANEQIKNIADLEGKMAKKDAGADGAHPRSRNDVADVVVSDKVSDDDDDVDARPKPKKKRNAAKKPSPRPVAKNSQRTKKLPDVASCDKGSSTQKSNQIQTQIADVPVSDDSGDLTDIYGDPPKKGRTGLVRSYAIGLIPDTGPAAKGNDDDNEPATEQEMQLNTEDEPEEDDSETPKKRKVVKQKVRDLVKTRREDLAIPEAHEDMEVCEVGGLAATTATKTSEVGKIQNWTAQVAKANKSKVPHPGTVTQAFTSSSTTAVRRTTTSSSAVVTQAVPITKPLKKRTKFEPKAVTNLAAFLDEPEDESAEREAALSSPIKGNQRLTSKGIVKLEEKMSPLPKRTLGGKKYTNSELPSGAQDNGVWRQAFIPTYVQYLASRNSKDAWTITDDDAITLMQQIWNFVYGARVSYNIKTRGPVFFLANQRVCEWHSGFGSSALAIVNAFFKADTTNDFNSDDSCKDFAKSMLGDFTFLFGSIKETKKKVIRKNIFHGPFVLQTFATHLNYIDGAVTVLGGSGINDHRNSYIALALSAAAVERALTFWSDGHVTLNEAAGQGGKLCVIRKAIDQQTGKETKATEFNQAKWGAATNGYLNSIKTNLACGKFDWAGFIKAASKFKKPSRHGEDSAVASSSTATGHINARAVLVDDSDDSDGSQADISDHNGPANGFAQ